MSNKRIELQFFLERILGTKNVYFQPPESKKIIYPAIVYSLNRIDNEHADDDVYKQDYSYQLILIDKNPDSKIIDKIARLPMCTFDRNFTSDNLNHYVFTLYY